MRLRRSLELLRQALGFALTLALMVVRFQLVLLLLRNLQGLPRFGLSLLAQL